jgi:hypothetical protein
MGFAYYPDGAHDGKDELEPGIVPPGSSSSCNTTSSCPAPMYFQGGAYLGKYSNLPINNDTTAISKNGDLEDNDFGLDFYEPKFFHPLGDWLSYGSFEILLYFDDTEIEQDIFYFCHVSIMSIYCFPTRAKQCSLPNRFSSLMTPTDPPVYGWSNQAR